MELTILFFLVLLNGVFALSEMAIVSSRRPRLKAMADKGNVGAKVALRLLDDPSKLLSTVQIGITAIGVIAGAYSATSLSDDLAPWVAGLHPAFQPHAPAIAFGIVIVFTTFLSLVLGELIPKRIAVTGERRRRSMNPRILLNVSLVVAPEQGEPPDAVKRSTADIQPSRHRVRKAPVLRRRVLGMMSGNIPHPSDRYADR
jgi:CBS domain containing-hemolysin-like protein